MIWDQSGAPHTLEQQSVSTCVAVAANGQFCLLGSPDGTVRIRSLDTRQEIGVFRPPHQGPVTAVAISRDGKWAVSGCGLTKEVKGKEVAVDCSIRLWNVATGQVVRSF